MADSTPVEPTYGYVTLTEAAALFAARTDNALWSAYSDDQQAAALQQAAGALDSLYYAGAPTDPAQGTAFPRVGLETRDGYPIAQDAIPADVQAAQCLEALALLQLAGAQDSQRAALQAQGVTRFTLGDLTEEYDLNKATAGRAVLSSAAFQLLKPYLRRSGSRATAWPVHW